MNAVDFAIRNVCDRAMLAALRCPGYSYGAHTGGFDKGVWDGCCLATKGGSHEAVIFAPNRDRADGQLANFIAGFQLAMPGYARAFGMRLSGTKDRFIVLAEDWFAFV